MVDTMLLVSLSHGGTNAEQMQWDLEVPTDANHAPAKKTAALNRRGLDARELLSPPAGGEVFSLDIPFYRTAFPNFERRNCHRQS
jgi:hypothetical protein